MPASRLQSLSLVLILLTAPAYGQERSWPMDILKRTFKIDSATLIDVPIEEIYQGCAQRDCIPSIDKPEFVPATEVRNLADDDLVLGIESGGVVRAYPAFILNFHEIVNDFIGEEAIAVSFCPLCGSGVAFRRKIDGEVVEFGVSGLLHNSDLIMYDRSSNSLWQQITGEAISGPRRGQRLETLPLTMTTWREWRSAHPDSSVLKGVRGTSYANKKPYGEYEESEQLMFPAYSGSANVLHPKQVVHGVRFDGGAAAVTERALRAEPELQMTVGGRELHWRLHDSGHVEVRISGDEAASPIATRMFWFAWYSFNTDTALRDIPKQN